MYVKKSKDFFYFLLKYKNINGPISKRREKKVLIRS